MKVSKSVQLEASKLIDAMRSAKVKAFHIDAFGLGDRDNMHRLVKLARAHCKLQEHSCNGELTPRQASREKNIEKEIAGICKVYQLTPEFQGDPRGYTVKVHSPKKNVWNTWGGAESGYGIGENN
jgi:hypothetical protein